MIGTVTAGQTPTASSLGINVKDAPYNAVGNGITDDTAAIMNAGIAASAANRPLYLPTSTYLVTALPTLDRMVGDGPGMTIILYKGAGTLKQFTGLQGAAFRNLEFKATGAGATLLRLTGCFRCSFDNVTFTGLHDDATGATYRGQVGLALDGNSGGQSFNTVTWRNLGVGVRTSCIQNHIIDSRFSRCWRSSWGDTATSPRNAGMNMTQVEFVGGATGTTETHIYVDGSANAWNLFGCWFEKADWAARVGVSGVGGPSQWNMFGCKIGVGATGGIQYNHCRQPGMYGVSFNNDQGYTSANEFVIDPINVSQGISFGCITTLTGHTDIARSLYPSGWNVIDRTQALVGGGSLKLRSYTTGQRPSATTVGQGATVFDNTLKKPVWSDGTNWRDAAGTVV